MGFFGVDTGLYLHESGLDIAEWMLDAPEKFVNRGKLAEMFVGLELLKSGDPTHENSLYYALCEESPKWHFVILGIPLWCPM